MSAIDFAALVYSDVNAYALLIGLCIAYIVYLMWSAYKTGKVEWTDLITSKGTSKVSLTKFLQLVGGATGTWIMIHTTMHGNLTEELFFVYLTYVGAIEGWSKFVSARWGTGNGAGSSHTVSQSPRE